MEKVLSLCWEIWKDRNTVHHGGGQRTGKAMTKSSASLVEEYRAANERESCLNPAVQIKWHPPDPSRFKMNVDVAVLTTQRATGFGMVIRNLLGTVLAAMSKRIPATLAVLEAKVKSMETTVQFAWEISFREIYFETDSLTLRNILTGTLEAPASIETITDITLA